MLHAISSKFILIPVIIFFVGCSSMNKLNKYNSLGYTFLIYETDTLSFDRIYLDNNYSHTFKIDKYLKTISYSSTTDSLGQLLSFKQIEELYKDSAQQIAFLIFQSDLIGAEINATFNVRC